MKYEDFLKEIEQDPEYLEAKANSQVRFALGDALIQGRIQRGWTQEELAERVGTKQANISRIEDGHANPTVNLIQRILRVLDLEVSFTPRPTSVDTQPILVGAGAIKTPGVHAIQEEKPKYKRSSCKRKSGG